MLKLLRALGLTATMLTAAAAATPGHAAPMAVADARSSPQASGVETVQWRGHRGGWRGHRGWGWGGVGAGIVGGAIAGSLLAPRYYYDDDGYYYGRRYYYADPSADSVSYCASRFRSYDPASGTYLGYDGIRHPCP